MKLDLGSRGELNPSEAAGAQSCLSSSYKQLDEAFRHPDQGRLGAEAAGLCLQHGSSPSPSLLKSLLTENHGAEVQQLQQLQAAKHSC